VDTDEERPRITHKVKAMKKPKNVREVVLQGGNLMSGFVTTQEHFTGPNTVVRRGQRELDGWGDGWLVLPFVETVKFCPDARGRKVIGDVRNAALLGFGLFDGFSAADDEFTGPHTVIRRGEWELDVDKGIEIPFTASIKFGRPRITAG